MYAKFRLLKPNGLNGYKKHRRINKISISHLNARRWRDIFVYLHGVGFI